MGMTERKRDGKTKKEKKDRGEEGKPDCEAKHEENNTFIINDTKKTCHVRSHTHTHLVEEAVEVHMHALSGEGVEEDVLPVAVPQTQDVAHHGHQCCGTTVC